MATREGRNPLTTGKKLPAPREHQWALVGYTADEEEVGQCENPSCRRFRVGTSDVLLTARQLERQHPGNSATHESCDRCKRRVFERLHRTHKDGEYICSECVTAGDN